VGLQRQTLASNDELPLVVGHVSCRRAGPSVVAARGRVRPLAVWRFPTRTRRWS
jgi:hypothetical protein